jgi:hypothetical protein
VFVTAVPEPGSLILLGTDVTGLYGCISQEIREIKAPVKIISLSGRALPGYLGSAAATRNVCQLSCSTRFRVSRLKQIRH